MRNGLDARISKRPERLPKSHGVPLWEQTPADVEEGIKYLGKLLPTLRPEMIAVQAVAWLQRRHAVRTQLDATKFTADTWGETRREYEKCMAWDTALQRYLLAEESCEARSAIAADIQKRLAESPTFFEDAVALVRTVTGADVHRFDWLRRHNRHEKEQFRERARKFLHEFERSPSGNYLLGLFARVEDRRMAAETADQCFRGDTGLYGWKPFLLTDSEYAMFAKQHDHGQLLVALPSDREKIADLLRQLEAAYPAYASASEEKARILEPYMGSDISNWPYDISDIWYADAPEQKAYYRIQHAIHRFFFDEAEDRAESATFSDTPRKDRIVTIDDLLIPREDNVVLSEEERHAISAQQIFFAEPIRDELAGDMGILMQALSLREQFAFFNIARTATIGNADELKAFGHVFGINGLRTFLTASYDEKMSERIFTFAALTDREIVKDVFANYANMLDNAEKVTVAVAEGRDEGDDISQFSNQLFEAFVRRSAHLFYGAEKIAKWHDAEAGGTMRDL